MTRERYCLLAIRGKPLFLNGRQTTVLQATRREHSRKPDEFYAAVEQLCPGAKVEIFAREQRSGWESFGNATETFVGLQSSTTHQEEQ